MKKDKDNVKFKVKSFNDALECVLMEDFPIDGTDDDIDCPYTFLSRKAFGKFRAISSSCCDWCEVVNKNGHACPTFGDVIDYFDRIAVINITDLKKQKYLI